MSREPEGGVSDGSELLYGLLGAGAFFIGLNSLAVAVVFCLLGGIFTGVFAATFGTPFDDWALDERAVVVEGEVTEVTSTSMTVMDEPIMEVRYRYALEGERAGAVGVPESHLLVDRGQGQVVGVEALPDEPDVSRIVGTRAAVAWWVSAVGLLFLLIGLGGGLWGALLLALGSWLLWRALR